MSFDKTPTVRYILSFLMIRADNLTKTFNQFVAVNHIHLDIPKNIVVGLLGPNGAGKSTTMKMLAGCLEPTEGHIAIDRN